MQKRKNDVILFLVVVVVFFFFLGWSFCCVLSEFVVSFAYHITLQKLTLDGIDCSAAVWFEGQCLFVVDFFFCGVFFFRHLQVVVKLSCSEYMMNRRVSKQKLFQPSFSHRSHKLKLFQPSFSQKRLGRNFGLREMGRC